MRQGDGHLAGYKDPLFTGDSKVSARRTSRPLSPTHLLHLPHWGMGRYGRQASVGRCASSDGHRATLPSHNSSLSPSSCHPASEPMSLEEGGEKKGRGYHPPGRRAALRVPGGPKIPQERLAEACGRSWGAQHWQGGSYHLPEREQGLRVGGPDTGEGRPTSGVTSAAGGGGARLPGRGTGRRGSGQPWGAEPQAWRHLAELNWTGLPPALF